MMRTDELMDRRGIRVPRRFHVRKRFGWRHDNDIARPGDDATLTD
jgi:hypothetical protein